MIKDLEGKRIAAMVAADVHTLDTLLHADLRFGHTNGHADDKPAYLAKLTGGAVRYFDANQHVLNVQVVGDTALVSFHLTMRAELAAGSRQLNVIGLAVWVLSAGSWKMISHHPTVVDFEPASSMMPN